MTEPVLRRRVRRAVKQRAAVVFCELVGEEVAVGLTRLADDQFGLKVNLTSEPVEEIDMPDEVDVQVEVVGKLRKR